MNSEASGAIISKCGKYRYVLWRKLNSNTQGDHGRTCLFVMLNPSTADATYNDRTVIRCMGYAIDWHYDRLEIVNVYAYRATDPSELPALMSERHGELYKKYFEYSVKNADLVICGWGNKIPRDESMDILNYIKSLGKTPMCLKQNENGSPRHPLYLKKSLTPISIYGIQQ